MSKNTKKAKIKYEAGEKEYKFIEVMFNPTTYSTSRSVYYSHSDSSKNSDDKKESTKNTNLQDYPENSFTGGGSDTFNVELIINSYDFKEYSNKKNNNSSLNILPKVKEIESLAYVTSSLHRPPKCWFIWSSFSFEGYVSSFNTTYTMFLSNGTPVRAKISLTFTGKIVGNSTKQPRESPDRAKSRLITEGQQLFEISDNEYSNPEQWREIANANNIKNPLDIKSGTRLIVPALKK